MDIQKAYDTVQHHLLWGQSASVGVKQIVLAAISPLLTSAALFM